VLAETDRRTDRRVESSRGLNKEVEYGNLDHIIALNTECAVGATENASTENESTGGWNMQVRNT